MEKRRATTQVKKSSKRLKRSDTSQSIDLEKPSYVMMDIFFSFLFISYDVLESYYFFHRFLDSETANKKQRWKRPDLEKIDPTQDALCTSSLSLSSNERLNEQHDISNSNAMDRY